MKRKIVVFVFSMLMLVSSNSYAENFKLFSDTGPNDWFMEDVSYLVKLKGISGYPDGSFKPDRNIQKSEFIKTLISSIGYKDLEKTDKYWASGYIDKALTLGLIGAESLDGMDKPITRYEMARIISNTLDYKKEDGLDNIGKYSNKIKDIHKINDTDLYDCVLKTYVKGIISGYPDGSFSGDNYLSRAEASTVIVRIINKDSRVEQELNKSESFAEEVLELVNMERNKRDIGNLIFSEDLNSVANLKSQDMATYNYFDHNSPNYGSLFDMLRKRNIGYGFAGENIAMGQRTPESVVDAWMNSPGHKRNILNPNYNKIGIGVYIGDRIYWTQAFTD